ncbi:MAG: TIR domain-containing protein [Flammeovirgaceae bacterium]|nr:TIR domain-containing protein [Flammeovirgaceae bacterium]
MSKPHQLVLLDKCGQGLEDKDLPGIFAEAAEKKVEYLDLSKNKFTDITFSVALPKLKCLDISYNEEAIHKITFKPGAELDQLSKLWMCDSHIREVEFEVALPELENLNLINNQLANIHLPKGFDQLVSLSLEGNKLKEFPENLFSKAKNLKFLSTKGNKIEPKTIFEENGNVLQSVQNYMHSLEEDGEIPNDQIKMLLLGNSTVGKTSLINYLKDREYDKNKASTHGIEHIIWQPFQDDEQATEAEKNIKVAVWDFGGQEFYHATHSLFFSDNAIYLVLFESSTNLQEKKSPTEIFLYEDGNKVKKTVDLWHFDYHYWLDNINHTAPQSTPPTLLIQSKCEKLPIINVDDNTKVKYNLNSNDHIFFLSVEKTYDGEENYLLDFRRFESRLKNHIQENIISFSNSKKWQKIKNAIQDDWSTDNVLTYDDYRNRCQEIKTTIDDKVQGQEVSQLTTLTENLHRQGVVLHFKELEGLEKKVFVNPKWVTDCIYKVLDYNVINNEGKFDSKHIEKIAENIGGISARELLVLLNHFKLVFEVKKEPKNYIAPQYLAEENPEIKSTKRFIEKSGNTVLKLCYSNFLPRSIMPKFIATYGNLADDTFWKYGIQFDKNGQRVLVFSNYENRIIEIHIEVGDHAKKILSEIYKTLYELDQSDDIEISLNDDDFTPISTIKNPKFQSVFEGNYGFLFNKIDKMTTNENGSNNPKAFISYSHKDKRYFKTFTDNLKDQCDWEIWDDRNIEIGSKWREQIKEQVESCNFGILLISPGFLSSEFIKEKEFGEFLKIAQTNPNFRFVPVLLRDCDFTRWEDIAEIQLFVAHGDDYGIRKKEGKQIAFAELCKYDDDGLVPNSNLDTFLKDLVEKIKK